MDLIAREFGVRPLTGNHDGAPLGVYFDGMMIGGFKRQKEQCAEHFDDVIVGVIVVVKQDDVVERFEALGVTGSGFWSSSGGWQAFKW
jgi:hypothetical protein